MCAHFGVRCLEALRLKIEACAFTAHTRFVPSAAMCCLCGSNKWLPCGLRAMGACNGRALAQAFFVAAGVTRSAQLPWCDRWLLRWVTSVGQHNTTSIAVSFWSVKNEKQTHQCIKRKHIFREFFDLWNNICDCACCLPLSTQPPHAQHNITFTATCCI